MLAYHKEIDLNFASIDVQNSILKTIYFGGGTPSLMSAGLVSSLINYIKQKIDYSPKIEITLEANPTSFEQNKFVNFSKAGINRISLGCQSLNNNYLKILGRQHSAEEARNAIKLCKDNFEKFSVDFIYGIPTQAVENWDMELSEVLNLGVKHLSLYSLTIEKGTDFFQRKLKKTMYFYDNDKMAEFYHNTNKIMQDNNFIQYEISNYAVNSEHFSDHNLSYWKIYDYIGIGAGAHGRITDKNGIRWQTMTHHNPRKWLKSLLEKNSAMQQCKIINKQEQIMEIIMMSLRIVDGIDLKDIINRFNIDLLAELDRSKLNNLRDNKLLDYNDNYIILSSGGRMLLNSIVNYLL